MMWLLSWIDTIMITIMQMTLDLTTSYGYIVVDVVSIVGFVMAKQEGNSTDHWNLEILYFVFLYIY